MREQHKTETRKDYLLRVMLEFIRENWEVESTLVDYDDATCDGSCLADDIEATFIEEGEEV